MAGEPDAIVGRSLVSRALVLAERHRTLIKYGIIGATASALDVILFMILFNLVGTSALVAHSISVPTSVIFSFTLNARHNFYTTDHIPLRLFSFAVAAFIGYLLGYGVILGAARFGLDENIGKLLSLPPVFVTQYLLNSRITFYKSGKTPAANAGVQPS